MSNFFVFVSEFSPRTDVEVELLSALRKKFSERHRVSVERVVSGKGLANVYEFLAERFPERIEKDVHAEFMEAGDMKGKVVSVNSKPGNLCYDAMVIFASAYGSEVGSAALKFIPTGGLYVVGGLTPKNLKYIQGQDSPFMKAFKDKGRVSGLLDTIPLFAVLNEDLGLRGARVCALRVSNVYHIYLFFNSHTCMFLVLILYSLCYYHYLGISTCSEKFIMFLIILL